MLSGIKGNNGRICSIDCIVHEWVEQVCTIQGKEDEEVEEGKNGVKSEITFELVRLTDCASSTQAVEPLIRTKRAVSPYRSPIIASSINWS